MSDGPDRLYRVARLDELERIAVAGVVWRPIRRPLGVRSFGVNAYEAESVGGHVIEPHDETGSGAGKHEELYVVLRGRATFTVAGETIDAPAGTLVFVPDLTARREAVAAEPGTTVLAVGAPAANAYPTSPFEYWFAAEPAYRAGDYARAIEVAGAGLRDWPDHPVLHYQLACYRSLAGDREEAIAHLKRAFAGDPRTRGWAAGDGDLDAVRDAIDSL